MTRKMEPAAELLRKYFSYDPETGIVRWIKKTSQKIRVGAVAGSLQPDGRHAIGFQNRKYRTHRLIWAMQTGSWPRNQIDHANRNANDNRWNNLRESGQLENMWNLSIPKTNKSGLLGVYWHKRGMKWTAQIRSDGKKFHLGMFETKEAAHEAYKQACAKRDPNFSPFHQNFPS
jgi:HNH endonuclease/AP2 domain